MSSFLCASTKDDGIFVQNILWIFIYLFFFLFLLAVKSTWKDLEQKTQHKIASLNKNRQEAPKFEKNAPWRTLSEETFSGNLTRSACDGITNNPSDKTKNVNERK